MPRKGGSPGGAPVPAPAAPWRWGAGSGLLVAAAHSAVVDFGTSLHRGAGDDGNVLVALSKETKSFPLTLSKGLKGRCFSLAFSLGS